MPPFLPPWFLNNGVSMTVYVARVANRHWQRYTPDPEPTYQSHQFAGAEGVPLFGITAIPNQPRGTIIGTYGITGDLEDQWFLRILGRKAFARNYAVLLFDWRAHGRTAELSPTLTSDGIYEGDDFVHLAAQAKALGCPPPFWFTGFSLGGQLALWGIKAAAAMAGSVGLGAEEIGGGAVICPSLDSTRSLQYLMAHPVGRYLERAIANQLQILAQKIQAYHPEALDPEAIGRADSIWGFDQELVIPRLGFETVEDYYAASSPLPLLPHLQKPTLILYAADDPLFDPTLVKDLEAACRKNPIINLRLTQRGGHVGYISSRRGQQLAQDPDPWWAWNRVLDWIDSAPKP
ncbi:MAG: alpha/beta fold hydrolase [Cyanobacteria bacterium Co-bin13]|nr:alpha/beta fold hydrolase [Cyanobacteria bacterium Co-bin13]